MGETGGDDGVVVDAGCEAGGELGEGASGVGEENTEVWVAIEYACEDEAGCSLLDTTSLYHRNLTGCGER